MILCNNPIADDSSIFHNDVYDQRNNPIADDSSILHAEINDPIADDSSILHNDVNGQCDLSNNLIADDSSILHNEVNGQHDLKSLSTIISKPGLKMGCLNIRGLLGKID